MKNEKCLKYLRSNERRILTGSELVNPAYAQSYCWIMKFGKTVLSWTQFEDFNE